MKTSFLFSIHIGVTQLYPTYEDYLNHVDRVCRGVQRILKPLKLQSKVEFHRRVEHGEGSSEWMDVRLAQSDQFDLLRVLESSIGSDHTFQTLESASIERHVRQAARHLQQLMHRRVWQSADFLSLISMTSTASGVMALGHQSARGNRIVEIRYPSGQTDVSPVPNRLTSALADEKYDLIYTPLLIGIENALVQLTSTSKTAIGSKKSQPIRIIWSSLAQPDCFSSLIEPMKNREWISGRFRVIRGQTGAPKCLIFATAEDG